MDWKQSIYSDGSRNFLSNPNPRLGETIKVSLRVFKDAPIKAVFLRYLPNGEHHMIEMKREGEDDIFAYYSTDLKISEKSINYRFMIATEDDVYYYNQLEVTNYDPNEHYDFKIIADYENPEWVRDCVFYQIFPDRFYNGNPDNDVQDEEYFLDGHPTSKQPWGKKPVEYSEGHCLDFYGGDLEGIKQKIPYLKELGVNAVYINPIFWAPSHHKYDCIDYFQVDPHFGGNEALKELVDELHKNDMKIILDISVNHTGSGHRWFNKEGFFDKSTGAYNDKNAEEREYYYFDENGEYFRWMGVDTLPSLDYRSQKLRDIIYRSPNSVLQTWLKPPYNIDGWRLDVANNMARKDEIDVSNEVWIELRQHLKETKSDMYLLAEHWADTSKYLQGDKWDAAMNYYGFQRPVRDFIGDIDVYLTRTHIPLKSKHKDAVKLAKQLSQHLAQLPYQVKMNQFNLLDSHDVHRLHIMPHIDFETYRCAVVMLFTFPGVPSIYYGDEVAIEGDLRYGEGCRYCIPWEEDKWNKNHYNLYKKLAHLRTKEDVLKNGGFKILYAEGSIIAFARFNNEKAFITVVSMENADKEVSINGRLIGVTDKSSINEVFNEKNAYICKDGIVNLKVSANKAYLYEITLKP
ncbi:alpha amylase N-terminal ig-like domain-containing protein [Caloramator proteoclasticus]|uniref:Alpha-glucosidase n=1 Tax=Caloramator proteoclasticus DSM 10124 TaxID=1121262 RepID=A0A1M5AWL9_9CLOT|nr:alpha amylase N-terminal ig-like domain-containing protein [Caloramator proteoclasticus]SHF34638.1 alpha-glucosidase [Caloramator proteoclasticus DSM 10124]